MIATRPIKTIVIDAKDKALGRLATEIATALRGKNKPEFTYHQDWGDNVRVENCDLYHVTGKKSEQKTYYRHSGYMGNLRSTKLAEIQAERPEYALMLAVKRMLPDNKLRNVWLKRLTFKSSNHAES